MMNQRLARALTETGIFSLTEMQDAMETAERENRLLWDVVSHAEQVPEDRLAEALATNLGIPFVRLASANLDPAVVRIIPEDLAIKHMVVAVRREEERTRTGALRTRLVVAMANPSDVRASQEVEFISGALIKPVVATKTEIADVISRLYSPDHWLNDFLQTVDEHESLKIVSEDEIDLAAKDSAHKDKLAPAVKLVNLVLQKGIEAKASDLHIEPTLNHLQVRARVQGILKELMHVPKWLHEPLVSRLKILARLDITERRVPQDGRIKVTYAERDVDLRVSTLPTHFGEKMVLRILGSGQAVPASRDLGLPPADLEVLKLAAAQPQGLILVTGPTGSGKTTTLYSLINEKMDPSINIITVEDPIEFQLAGINQVQVNLKAGLTFAASLKSILRQDPDVILVGEIRDLETAEIAFHAAMTGHLVLSTLHTNNTVATIARLLDLGVDPYLLGTTVNVVVAQRLMRRLCDRCKVPSEPSPKTLERLRIERLSYTAYQAKGCDQCGGTGFSGRFGVYELLRMTPALKELINQKATEAELRKAALKAGTVLLLDAAMERVKNGDTSIDEVLRVIQLEEEDIKRCPSCRTFIDGDFALCPYCLATLKTVCDNCRQELKPEWRICPYCRGAVTAATTPEAGAAPAPATSPTPSPRVSKDGIAEAPSHPPRILVVDDDEMIRSLVATSLASLPSKPDIHECSGGREGLEKAKQWKPDAIVLDLNMPDLDGLEVCKQLRNDVTTAFTPVLMLTVNACEQMRTQAYMIGTDDYMKKPFAVPELHARINRLLRRNYGY